MSRHKGRLGLPVCGLLGLICGSMARLIRLWASDQCSRANVAWRSSHTGGLSDLARVWQLPLTAPANGRSKASAVQLRRCSNITGSHTHSVSHHAHSLRYHTLPSVNSAEGHRLEVMQEVRCLCRFDCSTFLFVRALCIIGLIHRAARLCEANIALCLSPTRNAWCRLAVST
jgi:hypothetical protein